jgi:hypothetical protein
MNKKRQHFVPKFYLRQFSINDRLSVLDLRQNTIYDNTHYATHCKENFLYGKDGKRENYLAVLEAEWAKELKRINENMFSFTYNAIKTVKQFLAYQLLRTPIAKETTRDSFVEMTKQLVPILAMFENIDLSRINIEKLSNNLVDDQEIEYIDINFNIINQSEGFIDDLGFMILDNHTDEVFITSEHPVIVKNYFQSYGGIGSDCFGIVYMMPISSRKYLILFDKKMYPKLIDKTCYMIDDLSIVVSLNTYQYYNSNYLFSCSRNAIAHFVIKEADNELKVMAITNKIIKEKPYLNMDYVKRLVESYHNIDKFIPDPRILNKHERIKLGFFEISGKALPFIKNPSFMYWRHSNEKNRIDERISLLSFSQENNPEYRSLINDFRDFLYWYFDII